ncbi:hypothetical protein Rhopal_000204-T1 [Rhodotorula paludigena]|uniref:K Homology domain-containing protein n=1 Tax=Rhodotorula paludigena TaxID=86838 RepID=A0AAV5G495_9BASI|nr:hypothetical protein Rhopal_000204-T1 [Rhodotorula paludigena]
MADSLTSGADLARKRSRSASPSHESAAKKANQATAAPTQLEVDDDMPAATDTTGDDADASAADPSASTAPTLMNVDSAGIPAKPVAAAAAEQAAQDQAPAAQTIQMRTLIVTQDASIIIGRGGKNVNEIRDKSGAKITVTEAVPGNPERIMAVGGALDAVSKAFGLIVRRINDEPFDVPSVPGSRAVTIRFIIPNSRMGSVIGKAGAKIKEIQEASGAKLQASEAMLPGSTERVLSVSGVADAIHIAVYYLGSVLIEHASQAPREQSYRPSGDMGAGRPPRSDGPRPGGGAGLGPRVGADAQTQQLFVPNELVGSIIGKAGANINHIRQTSQCQIKVNEPGEPSPGGAPNERLITITGSPNGIQVAVRMLYERLEKEKAKQMGQ